MRNLSLLVLRCGNIERAKSFYELFGMAFVKEQHGNGPVHYACILDQTVFEIYPAKSPQEVDLTTRLGFAVENIDEVMRGLQSGEFEVVSPLKTTEWGTRSVVRDPDGRSVELYSDGGKE